MAQASAGYVRSVIAGTGGYLPRRVMVTNAELARACGHQSDAWIRDRTGIQSAPHRRPTAMETCA